MTWLNTRVVFALLIGTTMKPLASSGADGATEPVEVIREVLLESGRFPAPHTLIQTQEGGYVVAGTDANKPWATRTDPEGKVQWRHVVLPSRDGRQGDGVYAGAATMDDDSTLLCGNTDVGSRDSPLLMGMLTRIDKSGGTVSHRLLYPQGDQSFHLNYLYKCIRWGDGFAAIGKTTRWVGTAKPYRQEDFFWLLALDAKGNIKWEKLLPNPAGSVPDRPLVMANRDIVFNVWNGRGGTEIIRMDASGTIKVQRVVPSDAKPVPSIASENVICLITWNEGAALRTVDEHLKDVGLVSGKLSLFAYETAYVLPDHSLLLFGYQRERKVHTATIARLSADLNKMQTFAFQPLWVSSGVDDALPTGKLGEFATVRTVRRLPHWPDEKRVGVVLAFIRVK